MGQKTPLTTGVDAITGTSGNDTINADITVDAVMSAADSINGGAGTDTLRIFDDATNTITLPTALSGVENISVHFGSTVGEDLNIASLTDVTSLSIEAATVGSTTADIDLTIGAGQAVTLKNILATTNQTDTVNIAAAAAVTSASLTLNGVGDPATAADELNIDIVGAGIATLNVVTTGAASHIGLANTGAALKTLNISGDKTLTVRTSFDPAGTSGTIAATGLSGDLTFSVATANDAITFTGGSGKNTITTGSGNDSLTGGASDDTLNAGTGNDTVVGAAGNDTITVSTGSVNVDAGAGDDTVLVTGLDSADVLKGGDGTDTLGLAFADADAADASTTAGAALRAAYSSGAFEQLRVTDDITGALDISKLGFNYLQVGTVVDNADGVPTADEAVGVTGFTTGATVEFRSATDNEDYLDVGMTGAALASDDVLNVKLNADIANGAAVAAKVGVEGINIVNVNAVDRVDDPTSTTDNGADDGYVLSVFEAANMTNLNITGTAAVSYTLATGTNAIKTIDASASTGNMTINVANFAGTERVTIKGSQGENVITGDDAAFGEAIIGNVKNDDITAGAGADAITGGGGRDAFIFVDADSNATTLDTIADFGKATDAVLAGDVTAMNSVANFQATATAKGGANADLLDIGTEIAQLGGAQTATDVKAAITGGAGTETVNAVESAKGILTLSGADAATIDTLTEWVAVANTMAAADQDVVAFEFSGNTYVFQQNTDAGGDNLVQLTGVTSVTGITIAGGGVAAAIGDIFVI